MGFALFISLKNTSIETNNGASNIVRTILIYQLQYKHT